MIYISNEHTCCFLGHRNIPASLQIKNDVYSLVIDLIVNRGVDTFLFGSRSAFDRLCYDVVSQVKNEHPHIKRIYVRAEYPHIDNSYLAYLLQFYEETYFPDKILHAGKASYIERNQEMINKSMFCIVYYCKHTANKRSGTRIAFDYAKRKGSTIMNIAENISTDNY